MWSRRTFATSLNLKYWQDPAFGRDPNAVITMADDQGGTLDVKLLELLCITRTRYKNKVRRALKMEYGGSAKSLGKGC